MILQLELYRFHHFFSGFVEFFKYVFTRFPSRAPFNPFGNVGYISSSVIAPEKGLVGAKGIFKAKQRKELQEQAEQLKTQIVNMKQYISSMVQGYGYKNVKEFLAEYSASKAEYGDYQLAVAKWEQQTGNKAEPDSLKVKLQRKTQEVKERENNRQSHHYRSDRGGR